MLETREEQIKKQYDAIFKYVGEKYELSKLTFSTFMGLKEKVELEGKKDDRKDKLEKFIKINLPSDSSMDEKFKEKVEKLNELLDDKDKIKDYDSFFKLGSVMYPNKEEKEDTKDEKKEVRIEPPKDLFLEKGGKNDSKKKVKKAFSNGKRTVLRTVAIAANGFSVALIGGSLLSSLFLGVPVATILPSYVFIAPAVTLGYFVYKGIRNGTIKSFAKYLGKKLGLTKEIEVKEDSKEKTLSEELDKESEFEVPLPDKKEESDEIEDVASVLPDRKEESDEVEDVAPVLPDRKEEFVPPVPEFNAPKKEESEVVYPKDDMDDHEYSEPIDNVTYEPSDFDFLSNKVSDDITVMDDKKENSRVGRHVKKNMQNLEEGYKERRIAELEGKIRQLEDVKMTLNISPILKEDEERKALVARMIKENNESLESAYRELYDLKGVSEKKDLSKLLRARKATLERLKKLERNQNNEEIKNQIEAAIAQINKYISMDNQLRNNDSVTEQDKKRLAQVENATYTTVEYVLDEVKSSNRKR